MSNNAHRELWICDVSIWVERLNMTSFLNMRAMTAITVQWQQEVCNYRENSPRTSIKNWRIHGQCIPGPSVSRKSLHEANAGCSSILFFACSHAINITYVSVSWRPVTTDDFSIKFYSWLSRTICVHHKIHFSASPAESRIAAYAQLARSRMNKITPWL